MVCFTLKHSAVLFVKQSFQFYAISEDSKEKMISSKWADVSRTKIEETIEKIRSLVRKPWR